MEHPIQGLMETAMSNIKAMVDIDTVVGEPVTTAEGSVIIPVSAVSFGFGAGGSDFAPKADTKIAEKMFGGGCGGGANVKPVGFLVITGGNVRYLPLNTEPSPVEKVIDLIPEMVDKVNKAIKSKKKKTDNLNE